MQEIRTQGMSASEKTPGRDVSASERVFLGAVLNNQTRASEHGLKREDFSESIMKQIFTVCVKLEEQGRTADLVTVFDSADQLDPVFLTDLAAEAAVQGCLVQQHAENIRTAALRRKVVDICVKTVQKAQDGTEPLDEAISKARTALDRISTQTTSRDAMTGVDAMVELLTWLDKGEQEKPITTGLHQLDAKLTGGFRGGKFVVVGARPSVGKSALLSFFTVQALKEGRRVLYVSLEMSEREIAGRMISTLSGISQGKLEARTLSESDYTALYDSHAVISGENFWISTGASTPAAIRRIALRMQAAGGVDMICVDYLQLLQADTKTNGRVEAVGDISRSLKLLAMEIGVPVIAAAQVNRTSTIGQDRAPKLSELRESGSIEQDADIVFLLHPEQGEEREKQKALQLIIAKNRQGSTGMTNIMFNAPLMRFSSALRV